MRPIIGDLQVVNAQFNKGFEFDGVLGNYVSVPHDESLNLVEFTITYCLGFGWLGIHAGVNALLARDWGDGFKRRLPKAFSDRGSSGVMPKTLSGSRMSSVLGSF